MNKKQLLYFLAIAEESNITRAAERLHIPQPYLSAQLQQLENELDVVLAERNTRSFRLTDAGKLFAQRCTQILNLMDATISDLQTYSSGLRGTLRLATTTTPSSLILPSKLLEFRNLYPYIEYEVSVLNTPQILDQVKTGMVDIGILRTPIDSAYFNSINLTNHPMVLVACPEIIDKFPKGNIRLDQLDGVPLLINYRLEHSIVEACLHAGFQPKIFGRIGDTRTVLLCALSGMGPTIVPQQWLHQFWGMPLAFRIIDEPSLISSTTIIWPKKREISLAARNFLELFYITGKLKGAKYGKK